ncbi:MAG: hypothetical protein WAT09_00950, partial [Paracoccaceae bacterium]
PTNCEADTWIIAEATRSICKQLNAETPKPPTYPFKIKQSQRAWTQNKQHAELVSATTALPPVLSCQGLCLGFRNVPNRVTASRSLR